MKKIMLIILIGFAFGQIIESEVITEEKWYFPIGSVPVVETEFEMPFELESIKIWHFLKYAKECYADTIRLEKFGDEEYLLMHEHYGEVFTERQLEKRGYFYQYRWITNTIIDENNPIKFEYIFIKEPTLKGFIEWLENKKTGLLEPGGTWGSVEINPNKKLEIYGVEETDSILKIYCPDQSVGIMPKGWQPTAKLHITGSGKHLFKKQQMINNKQE